MIIRDNLISLEMPCYFIAEIGSNFDGSLAKAKNLIALAKSSGVFSWSHSPDLERPFFFLCLPLFVYLR